MWIQIKGAQDPWALVLSGKFDTGCTKLVAGELQLPDFTLQAFVAAETGFTHTR